MSEATQGDNTEFRRLAVAHPKSRVCTYCDDLYTKMRAALAAEIRANHFEEAATLVEDKAWPHEKPESENEALYRLAAEIRKAGQNVASPAP